MTDDYSQMEENIQEEELLVSDEPLAEETAEAKGFGAVPPKAKKPKAAKPKIEEEPEVVEEVAVAPDDSAKKKFIPLLRPSARKQPGIKRGVKRSNNAR